MDKGNASKNAFILDGYVDEPACLGVPPYISPYVRYCAGVCAENGYGVKYATIDMLRKDPAILPGIERCDLLIFIAGVTVPGKYLGGTPADSGEINRIASSLKRPRKVLGGPIVFGSATEGGMKAESDDYSLYDCLLGGEIADSTSAAESIIIISESGIGKLKRRTSSISCMRKTNGIMQIATNTSDVFTYLFEITPSTNSTSAVRILCCMNSFSPL